MQYSGGDSKVEKCYWTLQSYEWKDDILKLVTSQTHNIIITINGIEHNLPYLAPDVSRTLVRVSTNLANKNNLINQIFDKKLAEYTATLTSCSLSPSDVMEGYYKFW